VASRSSEDGRFGGGVRWEFMSDVTRLIEAVQTGDRQAAAELLPLVYDELRKLAAAKIAAEGPGG
jgi:ECF sigma factor